MANRTDDRYKLCVASHGKSVPELLAVLASVPMNQSCQVEAWPEVTLDGTVTGAAFIFKYDVPYTPNDADFGEFFETSKAVDLLIEKLKSDNSFHVDLYSFDMIASDPCFGIERWDSVINN